MESPQRRQGTDATPDAVSELASLGHRIEHLEGEIAALGSDASGDERMIKGMQLEHLQARRKALLENAAAARDARHGWTEWPSDDAMHESLDKGNKR